MSAVNNSVSIQTLLDGRTPAQYPYGGGENRLLLQPLDGNVGIGTANPSHRLTVNGTIKAKEVIVESGWADHVFTPAHRLASLAEVEQHIVEHGRLPGMPSAEQVQGEGIAVSDAQRLLLEKVEELTLHAIEQGKRLDAQAATIDTLQATNAELVALVRLLARVSDLSAPTPAAP